MPEARPKSQPVPWYLSDGDEECPHCGQWYAYELEIRCPDCDSPSCPQCQCPTCVVVITKVDTEGVATDGG
jgi:hypothetical protein